MAINKKKRAMVHAKYGGHCAYCGTDIILKKMEVDHRNPKFHWEPGPQQWPGSADDLDNLEPSCHFCNHYKGAYEFEQFRENLIQLERILNETHKIKVAKSFGIVQVSKWDGVFFFERFV